jgi:hypothetical protein
MTTPAVPAKSFLKAMTLPDDQRRKMLEKIGAKVMDQLRTDSGPIRPAALGRKVVAKSA